MSTTATTTDREREREKETARQQQQNKSNSLRANPFNFRPATAHRGKRRKEGREGERVTYVGKPFQQLLLTVSLIC